MEPEAQAKAEYINYFLAALGVLLVAFIHRLRKRGRAKRYAGWLDTHAAADQGVA